MDSEPHKSVRPPLTKPAAPAASVPGDRRESIRRSFLRANTAVAVILVSVLALALVAVLASLRATAHRRIAEQAQTAARTELWRAYLSQARAARLGLSLERREESLRAVASAAAIQPATELRDEAIAALALTDFVRERSWPLSEDVVTQAFDRQLRQYAIGWANGDIVVRRVSDNQVVQWLYQTNVDATGRQGAVNGLEFSPDDERLSVRYQKGGIVVWDLASAKPSFRHAVEDLRHPLSRPRFSSDGRFLIGTTYLPREGLAVFDLTTGESVAHFPQFKAGMHAAPRPGTTMFAVNTETNMVLVLDWSSGQTVMSFPFPAGVQRMAWSTDGKYLALCGRTVDVHLWEVATGQKRILTGHSADVRHLAFDPGGERLASASSDGTSRIWDTRSGRLVGVTEEGFAEQFGEDGLLALSRFKGGVEVWRLRPSPVHRAYVGPGPAESSTWPMDLSPDGRWLASLILEKGLVLWDLVSETAPSWFPMSGAHLLSFHPFETNLYLTTPNKTISRQVVFDTTNGVIRPRLRSSQFVSMPTNFLPLWITMARNGRTMALGSFYQGRVYVTDLDAPDKVVWLKDLAHLTRTEAATPPASASGGGTLALSGDGRWAVCGFTPQGTKAWDAHSGERVAALTPENAVVQFSPDDRFVAAGTRSHYHLFQSGNWQEQWKVGRDGAFYSAGPCAFSPNGRQLAVAKSRQVAALLDVETGRELAELVAPRPATIKAIRWSRDGQRLVMGTAENLVQVWELEALGGNLASLGLSREAVDAAEARRVVSPIGGPTDRSGFIGALLLGLLTASLVTFVAVLALIRHRRLIEDVARTEALADERERELQVEREVSRLKSSFVSMVSHEFRTPLGVIQAAGGSLQRYFSRLTEEQRAQLFGDISNSSRRMTDLIDEVLLLGKVESGSMKCDPVPVDLPVFCRRIIADVTANHPNGCAIEWVADKIPGEADLDDSLTRIILTNLLSNAVKYSPNGKPVRLSVSRDEGVVVFEVRDQGIGIPADDQPNLFRSFHRSRNATGIPGSGLGLTIVKRCAELQGGTITFTSTEGVGSTFVARIPARW